MFKSSFLLQAFLCISTIFGSASAGLLPRTQAQQDDSECRCFPGDSCWPTPSEWSAFNETIGGRLIATIPIASVCHHDSFAAYDEAACAQLQTDWLLPETHYSSSSSIMAQFFANASCDPFSPPSAQCVIGTYVQYAVNATGQDDYQKTMAFASERNIRFVVRNTGHDYLGKSTGAGALALWTHHLTDTEFLNYRSSSYTGKAMKMGAGVQSLDALTAAHAEGLVVAVGQCQTVGVAGGYTQGGGHSFLASSVGLSADQVLEWEVVTATGQYLIATPTENSDLYWALSGGGGGTYAAVLSATVKAYPDLQVAGANLTFEQTATVSNAQFYGAVKLWLAGLPLVVDAGGVVVWGMAEGFFTLTPLLAPGLTKLELEILLAPLLAYLSLNKIPYTSYIAGYTNLLDAYNELNPFQDVTDGNMGAYLLPRDLVTSESTLTQLTDVLEKLVTGTTVQAGGVAMNVARGQALSNPVPNAANPAWQDSINYMAFGLPYNDTSFSADVEEWKLITDVYAPEANALVPGGLSSYLNEANPFDPNWKFGFYGNNYDRLLQIKDKYDPNQLFYGLTAVGSDRWVQQADGRLCKA